MKDLFNLCFPLQLENKALPHFGAHLHDDAYLHDGDDASSFYVLLHGREKWRNFLKNVFENDGSHDWNGWPYQESLQVFVIFPPFVSWLHPVVQGSILPF